eukprot:UN33405
MNKLSNITQALTRTEVKKTIENWLQEATSENSSLQSQIKSFKARLGVSKLKIPCVYVNLNVQLILQFLSSRYNWHKDFSDFTRSPQANDDVRRMCLMLDKASNSPEILFSSYLFFC